MNVQHIKDTIALMERVIERKDSLAMTAWQFSGVNLVIDEDEAHECGSVCCVAGWVGVSKSFQDFGGKVLSNGSPYLTKTGEDGYWAIASYLDVPINLARGLTGYTWDGDFDGGWQFYQKEVISPHDVIDKLELILKGELT
jgi:hypothetical protein